MLKIVRVSINRYPLVSVRLNRLTTHKSDSRGMQLCTKLIHIKIVDAQILVRYNRKFHTRSQLLLAVIHRPRRSNNYHFALYKMRGDINRFFIRGIRIYQQSEKGVR